MEKKNPGNLTGVSGAHFVAAELSRKGHIALLTVKNTRGIDLLVSNESFSKMIGMQVKTNYSNKKEWVLNETAEALSSKNVYYVFVNLNGDTQLPDYYIVPSKVVSIFLKETHQEWLSTPGKKGQQHNDSPIRKYKDQSHTYLNRWDLLGL